MLALCSYVHLQLLTQSNLPQIYTDRVYVEGEMFACALIYNHTQMAGIIKVLKAMLQSTLPFR